MLVNCLKLNKDKTELLSAKHLPLYQLFKTSLSTMRLFTPHKKLKILVLILTIIFFSKIMLQASANHLFFHLRNISYIKKYLPSTTTEILVHLFVSSKFDHCNSFLYGLPIYQVKRLQHVQKAAARLMSLSR